jgi:hypothetical protein
MYFNPNSIINRDIAISPIFIFRNFGNQSDNSIRPFSNLFSSHFHNLAIWPGTYSITCMILISISLAIGKYTSGNCNGSFIFIGFTNCKTKRIRNDPITRLKLFGCLVHLAIVSRSNTITRFNQFFLTAVFSIIIPNCTIYFTAKNFTFSFNITNNFNITSKISVSINGSVAIRVNKVCAN